MEVLPVKESYEIKRTFISSWKDEFSTNMSVHICFLFRFIRCLFLLKKHRMICFFKCSDNHRKWYEASGDKLDLKTTVNFHR